MAGKAVATRPSGVVVDRETVLAKFQAVAAQLPVDDDDADEIINRMAMAILEAPSWDALDAPWRTDDTEHILGVQQVIESVSLRESQFAGGFGAFLVVKGHVYDGEQSTVWTTSATAVVMQLAQAWALGAFPVVVTLVRAERPSRNGYYPQHLIFHGANGKVAR